MGYIKVRTSTDTNGDIDINIRVNCTENEFEVATANMIGILSRGPEGLKIIKEMIKDLEDERADDTKEDNKIS